jgi:dGTPase
MTRTRAAVLSPVGLEHVRRRIEEREMLLSPLAAKSRFSRGRERYDEPSPTRSEFQRDRDRVIHSKAFRRLKHKTQVFISPLGDHYVTRLTHTMEVAQIARTIARALNLNEDLTEAIALAHDLGHPPFGHAGEEALGELLPGGFRHNYQSLRVLEVLEKNGQGLNLTWETRESIAKHSKPRHSIAGKGWGTPALLEGQILKVADAVAYLNHDIGDAIRAGILSEDELPASSREVLGTRHAERIDTMVNDIVSTSWHAAHAEETSQGQGGDDFERVLAELEAKADQGELSIRMSTGVQAAVDELRNFMFENVYLDSDAKEEVGRAQELLKLLFRHYCEHPDEMPPELAANPRGEPIERVVTDYIAGMTDRYALKAFQDAFYPKLWSVLS